MNFFGSCSKINKVSIWHDWYCRWYNAAFVFAEGCPRGVCVLVSPHVTSFWIRGIYWEQWVTEGSREEWKQRTSVLASWPLSKRSLLSSNSSDYKLSWYLSAPTTTYSPPHPIHCRLVWAVCVCVTMAMTSMYEYILHERVLVCMCVCARVCEPPRVLGFSWLVQQGQGSLGGVLEPSPLFRLEEPMGGKEYRCRLLMVGKCVCVCVLICMWTFAPGGTQKGRERESNYRWYKTKGRKLMKENGWPGSRQRSLFPLQLNWKISAASPFELHMVE